ncbi:hypothetical protein VVAX_06742 [Variovorax paradoxus]|uniref:Uncharacterized protein n=1 Tax=Variovorax paradoxus TaxID=34073 RepID=A0A679JIT7_VARPD|nr:hypothetical protein VVAX_06742 [Variovorax paradoxus]
MEAAIAGFLSVSAAHVYASGLAGNVVSVTWELGR